MTRILMTACCACAAVGTLWLTGCGKPRENITMAGSTAFQPFAEKLADQYMNAHPEVAITIQGGGSALGIQSALSGTAQIGMADLVTLPKEAEAMKSMVVARDGIAVVFNPANAVTALTMEQVRGLFSGTIKNWKEIGGADHTVAVISREAGSGTRTSFEQIIGGVSLTPDALIQDSNGTIRETVANDTHAVGYLSHGLINERIKPVTVDGYSCTEKDIMDGNYRLVRPVYLVYKDQVSPACHAFLDYMLSSEAQNLLHENGLIKAK
ncbi:MAG TPA: phosphate ABC transporter substrate-binding protein [Kiritimatiellia bacterium]|nr:phosphate ABC transporter substrate-binding protein [Kiritimatiellia bacterium]HPS08603.1 phosphate ABC transporter substrate-binding protein [Kiritimatiellia bacterium]